MKTLEKIRALPHVLHVGDVIEPLGAAAGFDNVTDAKNGTTAKAVVQKA